MENQVINELEMEKPEYLYRNHLGYNRYLYLNNINRKVFLMMTQNFFKDMKNEHNMKIKTLKYWFLHNLSLAFKNDKKLLLEFENISIEIDIIIDYFRVIFNGCERKTEKFIFLPFMNLFSNWCNFSNIEKIGIHHKIIKDLIYLDDNYFFLLNYLRNHNIKFLGNILKNNFEMENGNNILIYLFQSACFKNNYCSFKNFKKIFNFLLREIFENKLLNFITKKNNNGKKALNLLINLNENYYKYILNKIFIYTTHKEFMEKYFNPITKNINHLFQLEFIIENVEIINQQKYENLYKKLLINKNINYEEKYNIIKILLENNLISIENDREELGRKLWDDLYIFK